MTKLYNELASDWYQLLTPLSGYKEEADIYHQIFLEKLNTPPVNILELGSGAGHNAYFMKEWYTVFLSDISVDMLAISRKINPECEHFQGDMKTLRLNRTFDAVFIHDAIMYMTSEKDLKQALLTAFVHCKPGGTVLISPDYVKETFKPGTDHGGSDADDRGLRYLEWTHDPDPSDCTYTVDYAYLMQEADGNIRVEHDRHVEGLFSESAWIAMLTRAGFKSYSLPDSLDRINFVGYKPVA
ncbi:MAG: class I SAM-dependent methyltransferase [Chitinophagaceae bacterium]